MIKITILSDLSVSNIINIIHFKVFYLAQKWSTFVKTITLCKFYSFQKCVNILIYSNFFESLTAKKNYEKDVV